MLRMKERFTLKSSDSDILPFDAEQGQYQKHLFATFAVTRLNNNKEPSSVKSAGRLFEHKMKSPAVGLPPVK